MGYTVYSNIIFDALKGEISKTEAGSPVIFDWGNRKISGHDLLKGVDILTKDIIDSGVKKGDRVIFLVRPSIEAVMYFFALLRSGAVIVLADPEMGEENFLSRIKFSEANVILQDKILERIERYSFVKPVLKFFKLWSHGTLPIKKRITVQNLKSVLAKKFESTFSETAMDESENMVIIFTSGTVAQPKAVLHSYSSLFKALNLISSEIAITKTDFLYASQLYFLLIGLTVGARAYIPKNKTFSAKSFFKATQKHEITSAFLLPYEGNLIYKHCIKLGKQIPQSFKTILFGSAPVTSGFLQRFSSICQSSLKVFGVYGSTEMLPICMVDMRTKIGYQGQGDLLGKPLTGVKIEIAKDGEILSTGPQLFLKYLGDAENAKYFHSGDLGALDREGNVVLFGRKKDMIIRKGYNIYTTLFESSISKIPGVAECSMVGVYDGQIEDEKVVLFIVPDEAKNPSKEQIRRQLFSGEFSIDVHAYPDEIIFIPALPRSGRSKKVYKHKLQELSREQLCIK